MSNKGRRKFIKQSVGAAMAMQIPYIARANSFLKGNAPSDQINVAVIGVNGVGWANTKSFMQVPGVRVKTVCDIDERVLDRRTQEIKDSGHSSPHKVIDYREVLDDPEIDAIMVATPDHWHAKITIEACAAGKDVYVEKPMANSIGESLGMIDAVKKYNRVVQVGQQQRSDPHWHDALEYFNSGKLGRIRATKAWSYPFWKEATPKAANQPVPDGVHYDLWLGPAPDRPFNPNHFHGSFRWYWEYAGGVMTDWGVHLIDIILWYMNASGPKSVISSGGQFAFPDDAMETPDTQTAIYEFDDFMLTWEHTIGIGLGPFQKSHGVLFQGDNGTLVVNRDGWEVYPELDYAKSNQRPDLSAQAHEEQNIDNRYLHVKNFTDTMRGETKLACDIENGGNIAMVAHLGNIAYRSGEKIYWDGDKQQFVNSPAAETYFMADYRKKYPFPTI